MNKPIDSGHVRLSWTTEGLPLLDAPNCRCYIGYDPGEPVEFCEHAGRTMSRREHRRSHRLPTAEGNHA